MVYNQAHAGWISGARLPQDPPDPPPEVSATGLPASWGGLLQGVWLGVGLVVGLAVVLSTNLLQAWQEQAAEDRRYTLQEAGFHLAEIDSPLEALRFVGKDFYLQTLRALGEDKMPTGLELVPVVRDLFGPEARLLVFDKDRQPIWPGFPPAERAAMHLLMVGDNLRESTSFNHGYRDPQGRRWFVASHLQDAWAAGQRVASTATALGGYIIQVAEEAIPAALQDRALLTLVPPGIEHAVVRRAGVVQRLPRDETGAAGASLQAVTAEDPDPQDWDLHRLRPDPGREVILGIRRPWLARLPVEALRWWTTVTLVIVWALGWLVIRARTGRREFRLRLGWQIGGTFLLAGCLPLLGLALSGVSRGVGANEAASQRWRERMQTAVAEMGRRLSDLVESFQGYAWRQARRFGTRAPGPIPRAWLQDSQPWFLQSPVRRPKGLAPRLNEFPNRSFVITRSGEILYARSGLFSGDMRLDSLARGIRLLGRDLLVDMLKARGQSTAGLEAKGKIQLSVTDFVGGDDMVVAFPKNLGRLTRVKVSRRDLLMVGLPME